MNKVLSLYNEGQTYIKRCNDLYDEIPGLVAINPYYGYIQLTKEAFIDFVKGPGSIKTKKMSRSGRFSHDAMVNGVCFSCVTDEEDLYGD